MKRIIAFLTAVLLLLTVAGCRQEEWEYSDIITPVLDGKITDYITAGDVAAAVGQSAQLVGVYDDDTVAVFATADATVTVCLEQHDKTYVESMVESIANGVAQPSPGDLSYFWEETGEWIAYENGFAVDVTVVSSVEQSVKDIAGGIAATVLKKASKS